MKIKEKSFDEFGLVDVGSEWYGKNWPVVYIIHDKTEAYVGETTSIQSRMKQHFDVPARRKLNQIQIVVDDTFNKSAVLDIESKLIEYMSSDQIFKLQNSNSGMRNHDYYNKGHYHDLFKLIWQELKKRRVVKHDLRVLENSDLFKYTPYKSLTDDQYEVVFSVLRDMLNLMMHQKPGSFVISGEAGTGKTVLAMYLLKLFSDGTVLEFLKDYDGEYDYEELKTYQEMIDYLSNLKVAIVVSMTSLRRTLQKVVRKVSGLKSSMVIGPSEVVKDDYDILIVDEAHRLKRRQNLTSYGSFDTINRRLNLNDEGTELDWVLMSSRYQILFYDSTQSIRPTDVRKESFDDHFENSNVFRYPLLSQLRSKGGNDYIRYVKQIFSKTPPKEKIEFKDFDFKLFDSVKEMKHQIIECEHEYGLSRLVAGYSWEWNTKTSATGINYDIEVGGERFVWNRKDKEWINSDTALEEVGSIHTTQGYDLNYVGIIIGREITYNQELGVLEIIKENYKDKKGKAAVKTDAELFDYIIQIYGVLFTRGIRGVYVYTEDAALKSYLEKYIDKWR